MKKANGKESRARLLRGLFALVLGSALLLACKLSIPDVLGTCIAYCGGGILLYGNYSILFGLLLIAGDGEPPVPVPESADCREPSAAPK